MLRAGGWTLLTAVNLMLFSLLHNPCWTTIFTIYKETRQRQVDGGRGVAAVVMGFLLCFLVAQTWRLVAAPDRPRTPHEGVIRQTESR